MGRVENIAFNETVALHTPTAVACTHTHTHTLLKHSTCHSLHGYGTAMMPWWGCGGEEGSGGRLERLVHTAHVSTGDARRPFKCGSVWLCSSWCWSSLLLAALPPLGASYRHETQSLSSTSIVMVIVGRMVDGGEGEREGEESGEGVWGWYSGGRDFDRGGHEFSMVGEQDGGTKVALKGDRVRLNLFSPCLGLRCLFIVAGTAPSASILGHCICARGRT